jgi:hypothetical protein
MTAPGAALGALTPPGATFRNNLSSAVLSSCSNHASSEDCGPRFILSTEVTDPSGL